MNTPYKVSRPETEVISLEEAREWLNMDIPGITYADSKIDSLIEAAVDYIEEETNLSLGVATYEWYPDCFPMDFPDTFYIKSIVSVEHTVNDDFEVIDVSNYRLIRTGKRRTKIVWSDAFERLHTQHKVVFTAGYAQNEIPPRLKLAVRALIAGWYNQSEDAVAERKTLSDKILSTFIIPYA